MFSDTELALMMRHNREMGALTRDAQALVDKKDTQLRNLRFALNAANAVNAQMKSDIGRRAVDDMLAFRAAKRRAAAH